MKARVVTSGLAEAVHARRRYAAAHNLAGVAAEDGDTVASLSRASPDVIDGLSPGTACRCGSRSGLGPHSGQHGARPPA